MSDDNLINISIDGALIWQLARWIRDKELRGPGLAMQRRHRDQFVSPHAQASAYSLHGALASLQVRELEAASAGRRNICKFLSFLHVDARSCACI
jgi:hypothetical protein